MPDLSPSQRAPSAVERVAEEIRAGIHEGRYPPGRRLVEADLTAEYAVSRGPLREALRRLAAEGLVEINHNRGARVRLLTQAEILAIYDLREALEGLAARLAAERLDRTLARQELDALMSDMDAAVTTSDVARFAERNRRFHDFLVRASDNPHLPAMVARLQTPTLRLLFRPGFGPNVMEQSHQEHRAIASAVITGDGVTAEAAMRFHLRRSRAFVASLAREMDEQG